MEISKSENLIRTIRLRLMCFAVGQAACKELLLRHNLFTEINHTGLNETQILTLDLY